jgi:hypothetical protein
MTSMLARAGFAVVFGAGGGGAENAWKNAPKDTNDGASDSTPNDGDMTSAEVFIGGGGGVDMTLRQNPSAGDAGNALRRPRERDADIENDEEADAIMLETSAW